MNPLVPTWTELCIMLGATGYIVALGTALAKLLRDQALDSRQRLGWLLILLILPVVGMICYGLLRRCRERRLPQQ